MELPRSAFALCHEPVVISATLDLHRRHGFQFDAK